jgi:hypothetical protein
VFYDEPNNVHDGVIVKRNIGLEHCQRAGCDFIIPLDCDEEYDLAGLRRDIDYMFDNGVDTLYSPIQTYYYDRQHCFEDSYFVPTVYRINGRKFGNEHCTVLCDPARKMAEGKYMISEYPMRHYSYQFEQYTDKINSHVMKGGFSEKFKQVYEYMKSWKDGDEGLIFTNTDTGIQLKQIKLSLGSVTNQSK